MGLTTGLMALPTPEGETGTVVGEPAADLTTALKRIDDVVTAGLPYNLEAYMEANGWTDYNDALDDLITIVVGNGRGTIWTVGGDIDRATEIPGNVNLCSYGRRAGSFRMTAAGARLAWGNVSTGGDRHGLNGGFTIDANNIATQPWHVLRGANYAFDDILVVNVAANGLALSDPAQSACLKLDMSQNVRFSNIELQGGETATCLLFDRGVKNATFHGGTFNDGLASVVAIQSGQALNNAATNQNEHIYFYDILMEQQASMGTSVFGLYALAAQEFVFRGGAINCPGTLFKMGPADTRDPDGSTVGMLVVDSVQLQNSAGGGAVFDLTSGCDVHLVGAGAIGAAATTFLIRDQNVRVTIGDWSINRTGTWLTYSGSGTRVQGQLISYSPPAHDMTTWLAADMAAKSNETPADLTDLIQTRLPSRCTFLVEGVIVHNTTATTGFELSLIPAGTGAVVDAFNLDAKTGEAAADQLVFPGTGAVKASEFRAIFRTGSGLGSITPRYAKSDANAGTATPLLGSYMHVRLIGNTF